MLISRRKLLTAIPALGASAIGGGYVGKKVAFPETLEQESVIVPIPDLPREFHQYRIGFLTDIHLGMYLPIEVVEEAVSKVREAKVDLLLLGGDYLWLSSAAWTSLASLFDATKNKEFLKLQKPLLRNRIFEIVADLASQHGAPDGAFAVYGNHDRWEGPGICAQSLRSKNIELLINEERTIKRGSAEIRIAGFDDYWGGVPEYSHLEQHCGTPRIVLSHNPDWVSYLVGNTGYKFDLALCGHTHGGQINLPVIGSFYYNVLDHRLSRGLNWIGGKPVYTSRGIGTVEIPVRINCPPEATILTLERA